MFLTCYLLLCLVAGSLPIRVMTIDASTPPEPVPRSVLMGETVTLKCDCQSSDDLTGTHTVKWWKWLDINPEQILIYQRLQKQAPNLIHAENNTVMGELDSIVITKVQPLNSGTYQCRVEDANFNEKSCAQQMLHVYTPGSTPKLVVEKSEGQLSVKCSVDDVYPKPALEIMIDSHAEIRPSNLTSLQKDNKMWRASINATVDVKDVKHVKIICHLFYDDVSITHPPYTHEYIYDSTGDGSTLKTTIVFPLVVSIISTLYLI